MSPLEKLIDIQETRGILTSDDVLLALEITKEDMCREIQRNIDAGRQSGRIALKFAMTNTYVSFDVAPASNGLPKLFCVCDVRAYHNKKEANIAEPYEYNFDGALLRLGEYAWHSCWEHQTLDYLHDLLDRIEIVASRVWSGMRQDLKDSMDEGQRLRQHVRGAVKKKEDENDT